MSPRLRSTSAPTRWPGLASVGPVLLPLVVVFVALVLLPVSPADAVIDDPDIDTAAEYRYRVDPDLGQVEVTIDLTVTADKANRTTADGYFQYFFDGTFLAIPAEVGDLLVTDGDGRSLDYDIDDSVPDVLQLFIDFRRNLFYRQSTDVVISFTLPGGAARGEELTRVNGAYAGFQAWVDPRLEAASLAVITPDGFVDRSTGSEAFAPGERRAGPQGDELWFVADDIDPEFQWASVSLARDEALVVTEFDVGLDDLGTAEFDVLGWPGDRAWADFVTENLEVGLPLLIDELGLPWPLEDDLTVIESYDPYLNGYAGWYDVHAEEIEIGDELDIHVMFHELSHVWFNGSLFDERWITEGLADEFGAEVVDDLGQARPAPPPTSSDAASALALNRWRVQTDDVDEEEWAYGASWTVTRAMADVVGLETLAGAARAAADDHISYLGDGDPETIGVDKDWRLYLDLIENRGEVSGDAIADLFVEWVVAPGEADDLEVRAASRTRYAELEAAGAGWAPPLAVRQAMADWSFENADDLMVEAGEILDRRAETVEVLDELAPSLSEGTLARLPERLEQAYEGADDELVQAAELTDRALAVAGELRAAGAAIDGATGPLQRIGAIGTEHRDELAVAAARFSDGDLSGAAAGAERIDADVDELSRRGLLRLLTVGGVALVVLVVLAWWRRRRRRRRSTAGLAGPTVEDRPGGATADGADTSEASKGDEPALRELALELTIGGIGVDVDDRTIPVISLAGFEDRRAEITGALWAAATEVGFFQLADHGIPAELIDRSFATAEAFFALPDQVKASVPWRRKLNAGWESRSQVRPSTRVADQKESYQFTRPNMAGLWPPDDVLPGFKATMEEMEQASWRVAMDVLSCFADRLGFDRDFFATAHDPEGEGYQSTVRLLHYFPMTGQEFVEGGSWRAGAHTDYDCLTLLFQREGQSGLQVCPGEDATSGRWTSVDPDEERITCNIGDMLMRWSDDQLRSTLHRVRGPETGQAAPSRYSVAFFAQANKPALIESPSGSFESITAADFLQQRIAANFAR